MSDTSHSQKANETRRAHGQPSEGSQVWLLTKTLALSGWGGTCDFAPTSCLSLDFELVGVGPTAALYIERGAPAWLDEIIGDQTTGRSTGCPVAAANQYDPRKICAYKYMFQAFRSFSARGP